MLALSPFDTFVRPPTAGHIVAERKLKKLYRNSFPYFHISLYTLCFQYTLHYPHVFCVSWSVISYRKNIINGIRVFTLRVLIISLLFITNQCLDKNFLDV